ncbi:MAG: helix-hairpin-helix domain-containing protein, partial [Candidatus Eremiobacterota bacterium]
LLTEWLTRMRAGRVELKHPRRGDKHNLMELCRQNARQALDQEALRPSRFEQRRRGLEQLAEVLGLTGPPWRIECVDISNTQGKQAVGSMVVFEHGLPSKAQYRRFRIRSGDTPDDFRMMKEVLTRRLAAHRVGSDKFAHLPDLLVVDGGKGQLGVAVGALAELGYLEDVPVAALAKENEWLFLPGRGEPVVLPRNSEGLRLVTHLRDEAHRFAITYHRSLRQKAFKASELESAPGIGKGRRDALLRHFGSIQRLRAATPEELAAVAGIGPRLADQLYGFLQSLPGGTRR